MFSLYTKSPSSSSGSCSASEIVSRASQVGPKTALDLRGPLFEGVDRIMDVVEDHARVSVVHAVVDVVALLAVAHRFADHRGDRRSG